MGQPVPHGFPDWGRQAAPSDVVILSTGSLVLNAQTTVFQGFVGNSPYLQVRMLGAAATLTQVIFTWFADAALTINLSQTDFLVKAAGLYDGSIPVVSPYVKIEINAGGFPATVNLNVINGVSPRQRMTAGTTGPVLAEQTLFALGAGASLVVVATPTYPGMAVWSVDTDLATWTARLAHGQIAGAPIVFASMRNGSPLGPRLVMLPMAWVQCEFTNTTAGAGVASVHLVGYGQGVG